MTQGATRQAALPAGANTIGMVNIGMDPDTLGSGTISATDAVVGAPAGAGAFLAGASTAGSLVAVQCPGGDSAWNLQLTGALGGGTVYFEGSLDSTNGTDGNWIATNGRQTGVVNTVLTNGATTVGLYRGNTSGLKWFRVRIVGATAPSVAVVIRLAAGAGAIFLNASIPAGTNNIGTVKEQRATTSTASAVASSITVVTLLAANTARLGATFYNEGTAALTLHLGAAASATIYTIVVAASGYYEVPFGYTGIITGLWAIAAAGNNARVVEYT